jgi:hypothetical protein
MTGECTILRGTPVVDVRDGSLRRDVDITSEALMAIIKTIAETRSAV